MQNKLNEKNIIFAPTVFLRIPNFIQKGEFKVKSRRQPSKPRMLRTLGSIIDLDITSKTITFLEESTRGHLHKPWDRLIFLGHKKINNLKRKDIFIGFI